MSKTFRAWKIDDPMLLPATVQDFVDKKHLATFVLNVVRNELNLAKILACYSSEKGQPPFHPVMMTALLLYAYCCGIYSSRRIVKACSERVDFMSIVGLDPPDFRTIADFRKRHLQHLQELFVQVLKLCDKAGLVKLGHVAIDGSKIKANASKHKAMSYERMEARAKELEAEVEKWFSAAEATDAEEDKLYGRDKRGDELPDWVADKQKRAETIRAAKAELEAEAKAAAEEKAKAQAEAEEKRKAEGRKKPGKPAAPPSPEPDPKAQKNFTDPESRIMKSKEGFVQAYNGQIAVDAKAQIIVAQGVTQCAADSGQLVPMIDAIEANLGRKPEQASADSGYCSEANLEAMEQRNIDAYVATGRAKHATDGEAGKEVAARAASAVGAPSSTQEVAALTPAESPHIPMLDAVEANLGSKPEQASANSGYCSEANLEATEKRNTDAYVATGRAKHATDAEAGKETAATAVSAVDAPSSTQDAPAPTRVEAMREKIKSGGYASPYRLRKQLPEPVFGQIKEARGFRQFLMRGVEKVRAEFALVCTAHNLLKLAQGRSLSEAMKMTQEAGLAPA
jgi:transposase